MVLLAVMRGLHLAATLSVFGALLFRAAVAPAALAQVGKELGDHVLDGLRTLVRLSIVAAITTAAVWLLLQAAAMSGAGSMAEAMTAVPIVLLRTVFGHALLLRLLFLGAALLVFGNGRIAARAVIATGLAGLACTLQAGMGHPAAADGVTLPAAVMTHVLAAGAWLGGLAPLWLLVRRLPNAAAALAARRFSPIGIGAVFILATTAVLQGWYLIGGMAGLLDMTYGHLALAKTALFALLLGLAVANRHIFTPMLARNPKARRRLERSIAAEVGLGVLLIAAASSMAVLPAGSMRMVQETSASAVSAMLPDESTSRHATEHMRCS